MAQEFLIAIQKSLNGSYKILFSALSWDEETNKLSSTYQMSYPYLIGRCFGAQVLYAEDEDEDDEGGWNNLPAYHPNLVRTFVCHVFYVIAKPVKIIDRKEL